MSKGLENTYETTCWSQEIFCIGIDEAGRGPIAGPLVVAGVILPLNYQNEEINDSKKCTHKKREKLFDVIMNECVEYCIEIVSENEIDIQNIYRATQNAMNKIAEKLNANVVLSDAMPLPFCKKEVHSIIKGDQKSISIAAASILAKVTRDKIMLELDEKYPQYGFKKHKGYPTKMHIEALNQHGVTDIHRKSYGPVSRILQLKLDI